MQKINHASNKSAYNLIVYMQKQDLSVDGYPLFLTYYLYLLGILHLNNYRSIPEIRKQRQLKKEEPRGTI